MAILTPHSPCQHHQQCAFTPLFNGPLDPDLIAVIAFGVQAPKLNRRRTTPPPTFERIFAIAVQEVHGNKIGTLGLKLQAC